MSSVPNLRKKSIYMQLTFVGTRRQKSSYITQKLKKEILMMVMLKKLLSKESIVEVERFQVRHEVLKIIVAFFPGFLYSDISPYAWFSRMVEAHISSLI